MQQEIDVNTIVPNKYKVSNPVLNLSIRGINLEEVASELAYSKAYVTQYDKCSIDVISVRTLNKTELVKEIIKYNGYEMDLIGNNVEFIAPYGKEFVITICDTNFIDLLQDSIYGLKERFKFSQAVAQKITEAYSDLKDFDEVRLNEC